VQGAIQVLCLTFTLPFQMPAAQPQVTVVSQQQQQPPVQMMPMAPAPSTAYPQRT